MEVKQGVWDWDGAGIQAGSLDAPFDGCDLTVVGVVACRHGVGRCERGGVPLDAPQRHSLVSLEDAVPQGRQGGRLLSCGVVVLDPRKLFGPVAGWVLLSLQFPRVLAVQLRWDPLFWMAAVGGPEDPSLSSSG